MGGAVTGAPIALLAGCTKLGRRVPGALARKALGAPCKPQRRTLSVAVSANANEGFLARVAQTTGLPSTPVPGPTKEAAAPAPALDTSMTELESAMAALEAAPEAPTEEISQAIDASVTELEAAVAALEAAPEAAEAVQEDDTESLELAREIAELEAQIESIETVQSSGEELEAGGELTAQLQEARNEEEAQQQQDAFLFNQAELAAAAPATTAAAAKPAAPTPPRPTSYDNMMPAGLTSGGGLSQVRVYEQLLELRQRMNSRLSESNRYARFLEGELSRRDVQVKTAQQRMKMMAREAKNLTGITEEITNLTKFATDPAMVVSRMETLAFRLEQMEALLAGDIEGLDKVSLVTVPIAWMGVAEEVKIMGDFDNWTRGVELSPEDYSYSGEQVFSAELELLPGEYECKFQVDGCWLLGNGWPTTSDVPEEQNSLLIVTPGAEFFSAAPGYE